MALDNNLLRDISSEAAVWRQQLHQIPELGFEEVKTTKYIEKKLENWGYSLDRTLTKTGLIASLSLNNNPSIIAIRAEIDALQVSPEKIMHACGHDGHTAILLGAAKYLAKTKNFQGKVVLIFQAAEESLGRGEESGARELIQAGLFDKYPVQKIFTLHNVPNLPSNLISVKKGPLLAGQSQFYLTFRGQSAHAAYPDKGISTVQAIAQTALELEKLRLKKLEAEDWVLAVTKIKIGTAINIIPDQGVIQGSIRAFSPDKITALKKQITTIGHNNAQARQNQYTDEFIDRSPPVINNAQLVEQVWNVLESFHPSDQIRKKDIKVMTSDDFAHYLQHVPGCYISLGTGTGTRVHSLDYRFNDDVINSGIKLWTTLVEKQLT
ncbi:MAG: amidohydrolase [Patescibacteria group bacterium]|nr:amidohydrolase [Patescibacteria group bacterium]